MYSSLGIAPPASYPYPAWQIEVIRATEAALDAAWRTLCSCEDGLALLRKGTEPEITAALRNVVEDLLNEERIPGFTRATFGPVPRGQELEDFSGKYLEKRPDLTFQLLSARPTRSHHALFYECKILGRGRTVRAYVEEGVARFVDGRYAWCMPHGGMVAYLVDGTYSADAHFELTEFWKLTPPPCLPVNLSADVERPTLAISIHSREFEPLKLCRPGDITLRHVWLSVPTGSV